MQFSPTYLVTSANAKDDMYHSILSLLLCILTTELTPFLFSVYIFNIYIYIYIYIYKLKEGLREREGLFLDLEFMIVIYIYNLDPIKLIWL